MKRLKIQDLMNLQNKGLIKNINVPSRGSKAVIIPKPDCQQVVWMHWNLQYWCNEQALTLEKEFRFHETRFWRFDFAIPSLKIAMEYEGIFADKSGHTTVDGFLKDVEKYNAAAQLGWTILRYTTKNYRNVLQDLKQILNKYLRSMKKAQEQYRLKEGVMSSDSSYGNNGFFIVPHYKILDYVFNCMISDGEGWEHVSISLSKKVERAGKAYKNLYGQKDNPGGVYQFREKIIEYKPVERCPTWEEMCYVKDLFWNKNEVVIQFHPAEKDYVSNHHFCLHLWKPVGIELPTPDPLMVGYVNK